MSSCDMVYKKSEIIRTFLSVAIPKYYSRIKTERLFSLQQRVLIFNNTRPCRR